METLPLRLIGGLVRRRRSGNSARSYRLRRFSHQVAVGTAIIAVFFGGTPGFAATGSWILNGPGNWTGTPANWASGITPNAIDDIAEFRNDITAARTVTLNAPITLGSLRIGDALGGSAFTFAGSPVNTLTLDVTSGNAFITQLNSATTVIQAPLILNDNVDWNIFTGTLDVNGVSNAQVSYSGAGNTIKNGAGTLRLNIDAVTNPYTGNWIVNFGTLNIGGANSATPTSLGTGTGGITLNGNGRADLAIFSLNNNAAGSDTTATYSGNNDVILQGAARMNVDRNFISGAGDRITHVLDNLTFNGGILQVTSGNSHSLRFSGITELRGHTNVFDVGANATATRSNLILGSVSDDGGNRSLIKEGAGRMTVSAGGTHTGLTVIRDGVLVLGSAGGGGATFVAGGALSVADRFVLDDITTNGGLNLVGQLGTSRFILPVVGYGGNVDIDATTHFNMLDAPIAGMILGIDGVTDTTGVNTSVNTANIDLSQVANGSNRVWLGNVLGFDRTYRGILTNGVSGDLRLTSGGSNLILDTNANILGGAGATNNLVFGFDHQNAIGFTGNNVGQASTGTVSVRVNNDTTLGTVTVNRGVTLNINGTVTTPIGTGIVTALGGTISTDATSAAQFGNTDFRLYGGSTLLLDNSAVTTANVDRRLLPATDIALTSSTLRLIGDGATLGATSSQTINSLDYQGGNTLSLDNDATTQATRLTTLTTGSLNRLGQGTLTIRSISNIAGTLGGAAGTQKLIATTNPTVTNDMIGADLVIWGGANLNDSALPQFATYDATHGVQAAAFDVTPTNAATLQAATAGQIVDFNNIAGTTTMTANATMQALRLRTTANTQLLNNGGFTITIGSTAAVGQGAGLQLVHTANNEVTHTANFAFGSQEGLLYLATTGGTSGIIRLNGNITGSNGITFFGDSRVRLGGVNSFTGPLTINSGDVRLTSATGAGLLTGAANDIYMWGGILSLAGSTRHNNNVTFFNDARIGNDNAGGAAFNNLTVAPRTGSTAPVVVWMQNVSGSNITTAYGGLTLNADAQFSVVHGFQINGAVSGVGNLEKFMNERLYLGGDSSGYSGSLTAYAGSFMSLNASSTAKPFGTGAVTMNPGSTIRLAAPTNINAGQLMLNSDLGGISSIGLSYVGDPTLLPAVTVNSTAAGWKGALGIGAVGFSQNIDQSTLWGGDVYLASILGDTGIYTGTLSPTTDGRFLLGTGQGTLRIASPLTGANRAVIGVSMTGDDLGRAAQVVNNSGGTVQYDAPMTYTGTTTINPNNQLRVSDRNALVGTGDIILNGGTIQADSTVGQLRMIAPLTIGNNFVLTADSSINIQNNASDLRLTGTISLAPGSAGVVRQIFFGVDQPGGAANNAGNVYADGGIIDGALGSGNHFIKAGAGTLFLTGTNTFSGSLTVNGGLLAVNSTADFGNATSINLPGGGLAIWENSFTLTRNVGMHGGNGHFDVLGGLTLTQDAVSTFDGTSSLVKRGLGTMILNGSNAMTGVFMGDGVLQINSQFALGDAATTSALSFGGDVTIGGASSVTRYTGGTLRIAFTGATNRGAVFNNNGNTNFSGGIDVTAGNTFTVNGVVSQGTEFDYGFITGAGTLLTTATNTWRQLAMTNGTFQFANSAPWANSTATAADNTNIEMLGGTIRAVNTGANIALTNAASTTNYNYGGGMHLRMASGTGFSVEFAADNVLRVNQGTLVLETEGATLLGGAGATNAARVVVTNAVNTGVARGSALTNGIFAAHLIGADSAGTAFFLENDAATGFKAYSGTSSSTLAGVNSTGIGDITADPALTGTANSIYAFRTTSDVSGGTLRITAIDNLRVGGILLNGSNTISSNLIFDPASATVPGTGNVGEGLVYVKTGEAAAISGAITANAFTKFGRGVLTLSGNNFFSADVSIQDGTLRLSGANPFSRMDTELNINSGATLDLNGTDIVLETLGGNNRLVATMDVGGSIINTAGTQAVLGVVSGVNSSARVTIDGDIKLYKAGTGVLTLNGFGSSAPDAANNSFTGGTDIYGVNTVGGINLNNTAFGLGGFGGSTPGAVNLYSGTLGLLFSNTNTAINSTHGQHFSNQVIKIGAELGNGITLNVFGPGLINVNQAAVSLTGQGNILQVGDLNMANTTLTLTGGNLYRLRVAGTTTLLGGQAAFQTNSDGPSGALELFGQITGSGALNKLGDGSMRGIIINNPTNNYTGGTNIIGGDISVTAVTGTALGAGPVRVMPDGTLRVAADTSVNGANLSVLSRVNALGAVNVMDNFQPTFLTAANFGSAYGNTLQLGVPYFTQSLNMVTIGDGKAFLGSGLANDPVRYMATTLGAGVADDWNPGVGVYRIVGGVTNFAFEGANNVFTGNSYLQIGPQRNNALGAAVNSGNAVIIRNSNNYTGGTQITEGTVLISETGGSPIGETPLGTGDVEIYGEYRIQSSLGSNWKADAAAPTNNLFLRPSGLIRLIDGNINGTGGNVVAGNQGRWGDAVGIDLNGGQFRLDGALNWNTVETIGDVTARKGGILSVFRNNTNSSSQLNVDDISRAERGVLTLNYNVNFLGVNTTTPFSYERVTTQTIDGAAVIRGGATVNGAGVVNGGVVAPWIIDRTTASFVGYDPTAVNGTGFQPLLSTASPGAGQIAYSKIVSGAWTAGLTTGTDIVDVTTNAKTLADNPVFYALRSNQNISPTVANNSITLTSGGLILTGGIINPVTGGVVNAMSLNFGVGGTGEAFIYNGVGTSTVYAQINAAQGLTKFGPNQLTLYSINPGIGAPVVIHEGTLFARLPFSGTGVPVGQLFNGQDVILNAGALVLEPFIANAAGTASEIASSVRAQALFDSDVYVRGDATIGNNGNAQYARLADLTIANSAGAAAMNGNGVISLTLQSGIWVRGTTTLAPEARINGTFNGFSRSTLAGPVTGAGGIIKYGNGALILLDGSNNYAAGTTIWGTTNATAVSTVGSGYRGAGTPFGTGDIEVQPGGLLRIADNANLASNAVYLRSDGYGLGGLGIGHNGALPTIITAGTPLAGEIKVESTGPFDGVLALDYGYYSQDLNPSAVGNGNWWIGNSQQSETFYFNDTIGVSANNKYLLGGGGNQSGVNFGSVFVSAVRTTLFENLFSGGSADQVRIEIGAQTGDFAWNAPSFVNGNTGLITLATRNLGLTGDVRVNTNSTLVLGNNFALGSGRLVFNGGNLRYDFGPNNFVTASITLDNNVVLQGDWSTSSGSELVLNGNVAMSDVVGSGATRIWNLTGSGAMAVGLTAGSSVAGVISGAEGSNLIKRGAQQVAFRGNNTYQGYTQIDRGEIVVVGNVLPGVSGPLGVSNSPIILGVETTNVPGSLGVGGRFTVGRDIVVSGAPGTGLNLIRALTNERAVLTGNISLAASTVLTLGAVAGSNVTGSGGVLEVQGGISGFGLVTMGTAAAATSYGGTVSLTGQSNGYGINTYSGGTTFNSTRVEIGSDTLFSGPTNTPTIISGPLGTGAMTWTSGEGGNGANFLAIGGPRTIVNDFAATSSAANATWKFVGNHALTFTRNWNMNSDGSLRNRVLQASNPYEPVTFSGNLSNSGAQGSNLVKTGSGMLILTGTNTVANLLTTDGNYGTGVFIDDGILRVNGDAALGSLASLAAAGPHLLGPADVRLRGGYLSVSAGFSTARQFILTSSNGGLDVAAGQTLTLTTQTAGAFGIRKVGPGTLALNNSANTITTLTLGGGQQLNPGIGFFGHTGGVVSTTATSGTPFAVTSATLNSGTLSLVGGGVAQALTIPTINYGPAAAIALNQGSTTSTLTASTALVRAGAFNSVNYGTLTIHPSLLANLGTTEQVLVTTGAPANTALTGGDILTVPSIFIALAGVGQDANFTRYDAGTGFREHSVTTAATLATTAATNVGDIVAADTVGAAPNDIIDIAALRMSANVGSFDGSQLLRINNGGLIFNGATASGLNVNTLFGTGTGASLTEALVYVRDGQTGISSITGNVTARDFTKTGPGILELSGTANTLNSNAVRMPVLSVQNGTLRFGSGSAQFTNLNRPASTTDVTGHYVLNVNEAGVFDLNGLNTLVGGLTGNGTVSSGVAGDVTFTSRNGFGVDTTFSGLTGDGLGVVSLVKSGSGVLIMNGHAAHTGGTTVQAGRVTVGTGSAAPLGRLEAQTVTALGTGNVTLAGGDLRLVGAALLDGTQSTNDVVDGIDVLRWGGPAGYNVIVAANAFTNGIALPSNTTSILRAATQNALIGTLTVNAPQLTLTEGIVLVEGATTFSQANTVLRTAGGRLFLQGRLNAAGNTITKTGANDVVLSHTESGVNQNTAGLWKVYGGILNPRSADGAASPLGANATVEINGGSTSYGLLLSTDGDGTASSERVTTYADTTVRFGSAIPVSSNEFVSSSSGRIQTDRLLGTNDDKTVVIGALEIRGALGTPYSYFLSSNLSSLWVEGTTNFQRDWALQADGTAVTFNGVISGNGSLIRRSNGATVYLNAENTYDGGTFFTGGGRNLLGSYEGNQVTLSNTAKLGLGHVFIAPLATFQINDAGNLRSGQNYYVGSNLSWYATLSLAADLSLEQVRLRALGLGGIQNGAADYYLSASNPSAGVLALGTVYTQALDMRGIGDGMWYLGSATNQVGANGSYDAATLRPGLGVGGAAGTYRVGAGGGTLFFGSNGNANVLTDQAEGASSLIVGSPMTIQNGAPASGGTGVVVLLQDQNYTGGTLVNRSSTLDFRGTLTTSGFEVYGTLNVAGEKGTFLSSGSGSNIPVTLRPGSMLRFDNTSAGVLPISATEGRWEDAVGISLHDTVLRLQGNPAVEVAETVGVITAENGGNRIEVVRGVIGSGTELRTPSITRGGFGTVQFIHNGSQLGSDERVMITGAAPAVTNGMVAPWMVSNSDTQFVTYNADTGFTIAGFDRVQAGATLAATVTAPNDRTLFSGNVVLNAGVDFETYGLRLDGNVTQGTAADTTAQLIIGSGGIISNSTRTITAGIVAGSIATPGELLMYNNGTTAIGAFASIDTSGQILASSITKFGAGLLQFLGNNAGFTGDIRFQHGTLELNYRNVADVATNVTTTIGGNGGNIHFDAAGLTLNLRAGTDGTGVNFTGTSVTFNKGIVLGDFIPVATISTDRSAGAAATSQNKTIVFSGGLTFGQSNGDIGQLLRIDGRNGFDFRIDGTTTLNGRSSFAVENAYTGTASDFILAGQVSGTGMLIKGPADGKTREMTLTNVTSLNNWTDGTVLHGGTLRIYAKAPNVATGASTDITFGGISTGPITLMQGLLDLRADSDIGSAADTNLERIVFQDTGSAGPNVSLNGSAQINVDRTGLVAAGTTKQIVLGNLTMGQQWLTVTGGNSYSLEFGGTTTLVGSPYINNSADLTLNGAISAGGSGIIINKTNTAVLWINSANPTLEAATYVNAGLLAFGNRLTGSTTANLGMGNIYVNPGAAIQVRAVANINTGVGQQVVLTGTPYSASVFRSVGVFTQSQYQDMIVSGNTNSNQVAVLALEATNNNALDFATLGNGRLYLGASGDRTYGAPSIAPGLANLANSVIGGTSTNPVYRFTHTSGNTLTINLSVGGIGNLGGSTTTDMQIGNQAFLGPNGNTGTSGFVWFSDQNSYTGQTVIARLMTLRAASSMAALDAAGPLGANASALIDVYGGLRIEGGGSVRNNAGTANFYTNINFHPVSRLTFQDMSATGANSNRWDDNTGINLDGSAILAEATNNANDNTETVGAIQFDRGSRIYLSTEGTGDAFLVAASVARAAAGPGAGTGRGTLVFTPTATAVFGAAATAGVAQTQMRFTAAPAPSAVSAVVGMLPGYYMDGNGHRFVKNGVNGITPVIDGDMVAMPTGSGAGTEVVNVTATTTMGSFETGIYALRGGAFTVNSPTGANNDATITLTGSGADIGGVASFGAFVINPNLKFGVTGTNEALFYTGSTLTVNGFITAGSITKFGVGGTMVVANDQSDAARGVGQGYQGGWVVNEGALQFGQFGSAGNAHVNNTIVLNGAEAGSATLNLRAQPADSLLNYTYTSGKIFAVDFATIDFDPGADDRVHTIADIEIQQSGGIGNAAINGTLDAYLRVANNRSRTILAAGTLTVASNAILNVDTTAAAANFTAASTNAAYLTNSLSSGMSVASLAGGNRLTKWGDGTLYVRGDSSSAFSGTMVIDQGAVHVTHNGSLGTGALIVNRYGTLDVGVANYVSTNSTVTYNEGSMERWSVDGARFGALNLGPATLQIAANQPTANVAITLNGGGIQAWVRGDDFSSAQASGGVLRILNPNVTFTLAGNSFLGDRYYEGANGLDSGKQTHDNRPMEETLASGAILEIKGVIDGIGALTKVGYDTVILSANNTYEGGTTVVGGTLRVGIADALLPTGDLATSANGLFDLNGYNQSVGRLLNPIDADGGVTSGFITNSATTVNTLTVGNGASGGFWYNGIIQHNVALAKVDTGILRLWNANTYVGGTTVVAGTLEGMARTDGSPFGSGGFTMSGGELKLIGIDDVTNTSTTAAMTVTANSILHIDGTANTLGYTQFTVGSLVQQNNAGLVLVPYNGKLGAANTKEKITVTNASGLLVGGVIPWVFGVTSPFDPTLNLVTLSGNDLVYATSGLDINVGAAVGAAYVAAAGNNNVLDGDRNWGSVQVNGDATIGTLSPGDHSLVLGGGAVGGTLLLNGGAGNSGLVVNTGVILEFIGSGVPGSIVTGGTNDSTILGDITTANAGITINGSRTLILAGSNTYTGPTLIQSTTLQLGSAAALPTTTTVSLADDANAALRLNVAFDATIGGLSGGGALGGNVDLNGRTLTVGNALDTIYSGSIGNTGSLTKQGGGKLTLDGANAYNGATTITAGTLQLGNGGTTGSLDPGGAITNDGTFTINRSNNVTQGVDFHGGSIVGTGGFTQAGTGVTRLATNGYFGATTVAAGTLSVNGALLNSSAVQVNGGAFNGGVSTLAGGTPASISTNITVGTGAQFSAGASDTSANGDGVGRMDVVGSVSWAAGSTMIFDFGSNPNGTQGENWDLLTVSGMLTGPGTGNTINLQIDSWLADLSDYGANGGPDEFDKTTTLPAYSWLWVDTVGGINGFDLTNLEPGVDRVDNFVIDTGAGSNVFSAYGTLGGSFWVSTINNDLYLNYAAVPEPGSLLLVGLAGLGFAGYRRRKRRQAETLTESQRNAEESIDEAAKA